MSAAVPTKPEPLRDRHTITARSGVADRALKGLGCISMVLMGNRLGAENEKEQPRGALRTHS